MKLAFQKLSKNGLERLLARGRLRLRQYDGGEDFRARVGEGFHGPRIVCRAQQFRKKLALVVAGDQRFTPVGDDCHLANIFLPQNIGRPYCPRDSAGPGFAVVGDLKTEGLHPAQLRKLRIAGPQGFELIPAKRPPFAFAAQQFEPLRSKEQTRTFGINLEGIGAGLSRGRIVPGCLLAQQRQGRQSRQNPEGLAAVHGTLILS